MTKTVTADEVLNVGVNLFCNANIAVRQNAPKQKKPTEVGGAVLKEQYRLTRHCGPTLHQRLI